MSSRETNCTGRGSAKAKNCLTSRERVLCQLRLKISSRFGRKMARELVRLSDPIVVIEQPTAPEVPVFPIVPLNVFIAVIGGFLVGLIYAAMLDHMDEKRKRGRIEASERNKMIDRVLQEWMERKNTN